MQLAGPHGVAVPGGAIDTGASERARHDAPEVPPRLEQSPRQASDPRETGVFPIDAETKVRDRLVEACSTCGIRTVQDVYDIVSRTWVPSAARLAWRRRPQQVARRGLWRVCTRCRCVFPMNATARAVAALHGGEHFDPARIHVGSTGSRATGRSGRATHSDTAR